MVYLNGQFVTDHSGGHLPFEADVTDVLRYSEKYNFQKILFLKKIQFSKDPKLKEQIFKRVNSKQVQFTKDPIFKRSKFQKIQFSKDLIFKKSKTKSSNRLKKDILKKDLLKIGPFEN